METGENSTCYSTQDALPIRERSSNDYEVTIDAGYQSLKVTNDGVPSEDEGWVENTIYETTDQE